jgi:catechol 2,3-dioxygenase-like lactoylglutathione lyase family enzyme
MPFAWLITCASDWPDGQTAKGTMVGTKTSKKPFTRRKDDSAPCRIRGVIRALACISALGLVASPMQASCGLLPGQSRFVAAVRSVESVGMTVSDMDRSVEFYGQVLSFGKISDTELVGNEYEHLEGVFGLRARVVRMQLGNEFIELTEYLAPRGRPAPSDSRSNDLWFQHIAIVTSDMDKAYAWLRQNKVQHASSGPQTLPEYIRPAAGIRAFYFKDPDGHPLEILQFPPDKGAAKWHRATDKLFLGIDHTAIVVTDTDISLKFYRDTLGFTVVGDSENCGPEQEHLNNVFGARLRITSLRAAEGPGIELLEYLSPLGGRAAAADERSNDIAHHQTRLVVSDIEGLARRLNSGRFALVSPGVIPTPKAELGFRSGLLVRDPDGHPMEFVEQ